MKYHHSQAKPKATPFLNSISRPAHRSSVGRLFCFIFMLIPIRSPLIHLWLRLMGYFFSCLILWYIAQTTAFGAATVTMIAGGGDHSCSLDSNGAAQCWGDNNYGQLGDGTRTASTTPVQVTVLTSGVKAIIAGIYHTCAIDSNGAAQCWGYNNAGQLGDGTTTDYSITPVQVTGLTSGVKAIAGSENHTCAIDSSGAVKCWGWNSFGQLGNGTTINSTTPVQVTGLTSGVKAITVAGIRTCAIDSDGAVKCWGGNYSGQLGNGTTINSTTPVQVTGLTSGVKAIAGSENHICAIDSSGAVKCWGRNGFGQLGNGTTIDSTTPVQVIGLTSGMTAITGGVGDTCAIDSSGAVKCWGWNGFGQLGNGTTINSTTPVQVTGLTSGVKVITGGVGYTCAIDSSGAVKCWGRNYSGQLGNGTTINSTIPVTVAFKSSQTITFGTAPSLQIGGATGTVTATGGASGNPVTFSTTTPSICTVNSSTGVVTPLAQGTCTIAANQAGNADYSAASQVMQDIAVSPYAVVGNYPITECVTDNQTGLMWEGKTASGIRAGSNTYTNYDSIYTGGTDINTTTNSIGYMNAVNISNLCGFNDWRMPTIDELVVVNLIML